MILSITDYTQPYTGSQYTGSASIASTNNMPQSGGVESRSSTFTETVRHSGDYYPHLVNRNVTPVTLNEVKHTLCFLEALFRLLTVGFIVDENQCPTCFTLLVE